MNREDIITEYIKAEIHYNAMKALLIAENITVDGGETATQTEPAAETPQATPTQPAAEQQKPTSTAPEIVYDGNPVISLSPGESTAFSVCIYNVASSGDYIISPTGDPTFAKFSISGQKISNGFRVDFVVKAKLPGKASVNIRIKDNPENNLSITCNIS